MRRLIEKGLMFGNLVPVDSPALVERYNRALRALSGRTTALSDFHVDISGFSPEVADELGDDLYLNPDGANRRFILLTTAQKGAPLLNAKFSSTRQILRRFIEANEAELFALTTRDAVAGELVSSVFGLSSPAQLFDIRRVTVEADTTGSHVAEGRRLAALIKRFRTEPDAWWDDMLIAEMIELARRTGDVTRNPIELKPLSIEVGNFWTSHFGGLYIFRDLPHSAVIAVSGGEALGALAVGEVIPLASRNRIARFFEANGLVEPIVHARGADAAAILGQKMDFILVDAAVRAGLNPGSGSRRELRNLARQMGEDLPPEFRTLARLKRWAEGSGPWPRVASDDPGYFYTLRSRNHADKALVNQLLAELAPLDVRQLFICHKQLFYELYRDWPEAKKAFVADYLEREYQLDKAGVRRALFGEEDTARPAPGAPPGDMSAIAGPWGSARGRRRG